MRKVIVLALTMIAGSAVAQDAMTGDELEALLGTDRTITLGGPGAGYSGQLSLKADGTASGSAKSDDGTVTEIAGVWYIEGDRFCRNWTNIDQGKEVCETWVKDGPNKARVLVDGKEIGVTSW